MRSVPPQAKPGRPGTPRPLQSTVIVSFVSIPPLDIAKTHWILTRRTPRPSASQGRENRSRYCRCLLGGAFGPRNFVKKGGARFGLPAGRRAGHASMPVLFDPVLGFPGRRRPIFAVCPKTLTRPRRPSAVVRPYSDRSTIGQ